MLLFYLRNPIEISDRNMRLAGYLKSGAFSENVALIVDDRDRKDPDYVYACAAQGSDGSSRVLLEPEVYLDFVRGKPYARTTVLHELGHVFHGDLSEILREDSGYDKERLARIESGTVHERELRADSFAAKFLGAVVVIEGLSFLRDADIAEDEKANAPSIQELERRIRILEGTERPIN